MATSQTPVASNFVRMVDSNDYEANEEAPITVVDTEMCCYDGFENDFDEEDLTGGNIINKGLSPLSTLSHSSSFSDDDVFHTSQSTKTLRRTALIVTLASFIIGTGCLPLGFSALVLVCRKNASRRDYKNALVIATMASIVGLAINAFAITYIILTIERIRLQGIYN